MKNKSSINYFSNLKRVCFGNTIINLISMPFSIFIAKVISYILSLAMQGDTASVMPMAVMVFGVLVSYIIIQFVFDVRLKNRNSQSRNECRLDFLKCFLNNPHYVLNEAGRGTIIENINKDLNTVIDCYVQAYPMIISSIITILIYLIIMGFQNPLITAIFFVLGLIQLIPSLIEHKFIQVNYDKCSELEAEITEHTMEAVNGFELIKHYELKQHWFQKLDKYHILYIKIGNRSSAAYAANVSLLRFSENILRYGSYAIIGLFIMNNMCTMEYGVQMLYLSGGLFSAIGTIASSIPSVSLCMEAQQRIEKWRIHSSTEHCYIIDKLFSCISLQHVCVNYGKVDVLQDINLSFDASRNYLIEGSNGCGKSTLLRAITQNVKINNGSIFLDDTDEYTSIHRDVLTYVPQIDAKFTFGISDLLLLFENEFADKALQNMRKFGFQDVQIYGMRISDLSGGERKKLFLSIAIACNAQWMLLDEPCNNLDVESIEILCRMIQSRRGVIIVSHNDTICNTIPEITRIKIDGAMIGKENV